MQIFLSLLLLGATTVHSSDYDGDFHLLHSLVELCASEFEQVLDWNEEELDSNKENVQVNQSEKGSIKFLLNDSSKPDVGLDSIEVQKQEEKKTIVGNSVFDGDARDGESGVLVGKPVNDPLSVKPAITKPVPRELTWDLLVPNAKEGGVISGQKGWEKRRHHRQKEQPWSDFCGDYRLPPRK